jgi:hypothetical protein
VSPRGWWGLDPANNLFYWLNETPAWRKINSLPEKLSFKGKWKLTASNDLELTISRDSNLVLRGRILAAGENTLVFEVISEDDLGIQHVRLLRFSGDWGCDDANRIFFSVAKRRNPDILSIRGYWKVNDNQQISYLAENRRLRKKTKVTSQLDFTGYWSISDKNKLTYILSRSTSSRFDFKVQIETPNMYPSDGVIKYRLGGGVRRAFRDKPLIVCLYGEWKIDRKLGLSFNMDYGAGRVISLRFGATVKVSKNDYFELNLLCKNGVSSGITLIYTRRFLKSNKAEFFARLKKRGAETGIDAGITIPF